jgi:C4-dicarboxylate-specific signal transduction histidine kinase
MWSRRAEVDDLRPTAVRPVLEAAVRVCSGELEQRGVALTCTLPDPCLAIDCRPTQVVQVVPNRLRNAADAVESGGEKWVRIEVDHDDMDVRIGVVDGGPGVPTELRPRIAEPFFTTKSPGQGTGQGLAVSSRIMREHGGALTLADGPPTRLTLRFVRSSANPQ